MEEEPVLDDILTLLEGCRCSGPSCCAVEEHLDDSSVGKMLNIFRSVCSSLWMLHARDMLSLSVRKLSSETKNASSEI